MHIDDVPGSDIGLGEGRGTGIRSIGELTHARLVELATARLGGSHCRRGGEGDVIRIEPDKQVFGHDGSEGDSGAPR